MRRRPIAVADVATFLRVLRAGTLLLAHLRESIAGTVWLHGEEPRPLPGGRIFTLADAAGKDPRRFPRIVTGQGPCRGRGDSSCPRCANFQEIFGANAGRISAKPASTGRMQNDRGGFCEPMYRRGPGGFRGPKPYEPDIQAHGWRDTWRIPASARKKPLGGSPVVPSFRPNAAPCHAIAHPLQ